MNVTRRTVAGVLALALSLLGVIGTAPVRAAVTWNVAVVVYDSINATCGGRSIVASLQGGETDVQEALADLQTGANRIAAAGDGQLAFTVIRAGTLTGDLTPTGDGCWPAPSDIAYPTGFDSVYVLYEADADPDAPINPWGGLSYACHGCPLYATNPIWDGGQDWFDTGYNVGIFIHELGNNLTAYYQAKFGSTQVPSLYADQSRYRFTSWYDDWYGGRLYDTWTGDYVGLEPHVWASGTPTSGTVVTSPPPSPPAKPCRNPNSNSQACRP